MTTPPQSAASPPGLPPPITLRSPGPREVVDESRAHSFVEAWKSELESHRSKVEEAIAAASSSSSSSSGAGGGSSRPPDVPPPCDEVVLSDKSYTAGAACVLASFFTRGGPGSAVARGVTRLDLSDVIASRMEDEGLQVLQTLCDAFRDSCLVEVDLSDNAMGSKGISACRSVLNAQSSSLERLSLCNNGLAAESMDKVADILTGDGGGGAGEGSDDDAAATDGTTVCERLTKVHFFNNMSGEGGCRAFARILHRCTDRLSDVRFSATRAGRDGSALVASALDEMGDGVRNLRRLDLADNLYGPDGAAVLFRSLSRCRSLTYLNLRDCVLEDGGLRQVCHALWSNDVPLTHLDLSGNEMTRVGAKALSEYLEECVTLKVLHAEDNEMTSRGVRYVAMALARSGGGGGGGEGGEASSVEEVYLGCNECGTMGARALLDAYRGGEGLPNLRKIELDGNGFTEEDVEALQIAFGDRLGDMDDNDEEAEYDDEMSDEESDESDDGVGGGKGDVDVNALADALAKGSLISDHPLC